MTRRWALLAAYTALVYVTLPAGGAAGRALLGWQPGAWAFGPGLVLTAAVLVVLLLVRLRRARAGASAYALLAVTAAGWAGALIWLRTQRLERIHVPEYGLSAWLAWRAVGPLAPTPAAGYVLAAVIASLLGWGEEELQRWVPGRVYDPRDVLANALGAVLGVLLIATLRSTAARAAVPIDHDRVPPAAAGDTRSA